MALYTEGPTDNRFLPLIIQRTASDLLLQRAAQVVDVLPVQIVQRLRAEDRANAILQAAQTSWGYPLLVVHSDADDRSADAALAERIQPGQMLVAQQPDEANLCRNLVPIVPITMTEAWMLADRNRLRELLNSDLSSGDLGLPASFGEIERIADPKARLAQALRIASAHRPQRRRRDRTIGELYEPLGEQIALTELGQLSAYQTFQVDLADALRNLGYFSPT